MNLKLLVQASLVFLLPLAVYHSALDYPFQFDDHLFLEDENVQLGRWIHFISPPVPRFLTWLTFLTQYLWVGDGLLKREWRPRSWHLVYLAAIVVVGIPYWLSPGWEDTGSGIGILGTLVYAATQVEVVWQYVLLTLLPMGLNLDHHVLPRIDWLDPRWLAQLFMWAIMVWGFLRLKRHSAEAAFYVALFFLFLLPTSSLVPRLDLMFEHRLYASMLGFSAFLAWCFLSLLAYVEAHWTS